MLFLAIPDSKEIGLKDAPWLGSLFGLGIGITCMCACFQMSGMVLVLMAKLYRLVR